MTCIIGIVLADGTVVIGADSACSDGSRVSRIGGGKIVRLRTPDAKGGPDMLIGCSGSVPMLHTLRHRVVLPHQGEMDDDRYMQTVFVDEVRKRFKEAGILKKENEVETASGYALIGYRGRMWLLESDYQVRHVAHSTWAIGSGGDEARGALWVLERFRNLDTGYMALEALRASAELTPFVREPFEILQCSPT